MLVRAPQQVGNKAEPDNAEGSEARGNARPLHHSRVGEAVVDHELAGATVNEGSGTSHHGTELAADAGIKALVVSDGENESGGGGGEEHVDASSLEDEQP